MDIGLKIDEQRCVACGECVRDCPVSVLEMVEEVPRVAEAERCIGCLHCLAVCPTAALSILETDPDEGTELKGSFPDVMSLKALVQGRRSVRRYKQQNVPSGLLDDVLHTAWHAPTGVNNQGVLFTVLDDMRHTEAFRQHVYERLEQLLQSGQRVEHRAMNYLGYAAKMRRKHGADVIFRGAPHVLLATAPHNGPCPQVDCIIALSTFDLVAQARGIGTVWNGMLKWAVNDIFPDLRERLGIPPDHEMGYALSFGLPDVRYHRAVERGPAAINRPGWSG